MTTKPQINKQSKGSDLARSAPEPGLSLLQRFAYDFLVRLLGKMTEGRLSMVMPDGTEQSFGDGQDSVRATIWVRDYDFFVRCLFFADIGLAESYMDGLCAFSSIKDVVSWFLLNRAKSTVLNESSASSRLLNLFGFFNRLGHSLRPNSKKTSRKNISEHYDLGNDFFALFLDPSMTYSSALFTNSDISLAQAQKEKFARIAQKLKISRDDRVLEVGCGWGGFSAYLAETFGCQITAITISQRQFDYTKELLQRRRLNDLVNLRLEDYRDHQGLYDKIVSVEMIEAVGDNYMDIFIAKLDRLLAPDGMLLMQMITCPDSRYKTLKSNVDFIQKHIFPGSLLPSLRRVSSAMLACGELFMVDFLDLTPSYVLTLKAWQEAFENEKETLLAHGFDERFIRKWKYYFEYCQAAFAMRNVSVVQAMYSRPNNRNLNP